MNLGRCWNQVLAQQHWMAVNKRFSPSDDKDDSESSSNDDGPDKN